jgi:uncharacterized small protein (TIGR04563 family)
MAGTDKQKQSLYFPEETLSEIMKESIRLDRSLSWTVQQAWRVAREEVKRFPSVGWRSEVDRTRPAPPPRERRAAPPPRPVSDEEPGEPSSELREFLRGKFDREATG